MENTPFLVSSYSIIASENISGGVLGKIFKSHGQVIPTNPEGFQSGRVLFLPIRRCPNFANPMVPILPIRRSFVFANPEGPNFANPQGS